MTTQSTNAKIAQFTIDLDLAHQIVHGGPETVVQTEGGQVRSLSNVIHQLDSAVNDAADSVIGLVLQARDQSVNSSVQAQNQATTATQAANAATTKAGEATTAATQAAASQASATTSATNAAASAVTADTRATSATNSASGAAVSAGAALSSKTAAAASETNAGASAAAAAASAAAAAGSASTASTSKDAAVASATSANNSATTATGAASTASTAATSAQKSADAALISQTAAEAASTQAQSSAAVAVNGPSTTATSATSLAIGAGAKPLTLAQVGKAFTVGQWVYLADSAVPNSRWMHGTVAAYNGVTGVMTVNVARFAGKGSFASWLVMPATPAYDTITSDVDGNVSISGNLTVPRSNRINGVLNFADTRTVSEAPKDLFSGLRLDFKESASVGRPPVQAISDYAHIMAVSAYGDVTGGLPTQVSFGDGIAIRQGTSATAWGPWRTLWHDGNFTPADYLPKIGGTLSGKLTVPGLITSGGENLRMLGDNAFLCGYNAGNTARSGYLQFNSASDVTLAAENGGLINLRAGGAVVATFTASGVGIGTSALGSRRLVVGGAQYPDLVIRSSVTSGSVGASTLYLGNATADGIGWVTLDHAPGTMSLGVAGASRVQIATDRITPYANGAVYLGDGIRRWSGVYSYSGNFSDLVESGRVAAGYDSGVAGSVSCSNWFRLSGDGGLFFATYGCGIRPPLNRYGSVQTYGARDSSGVWQGYSINGGAVFMHNASVSGIWGIYNDYNNSWMLQSDMAGNATFSGNVGAYSDERLKDDWMELPDDFVERVAGMRMGTYSRIDIGGRHAGASAQEWRRLLPEVVQEMRMGAEDDQEAYLTLAYGNAGLVTSMALARRVVAMEARLAKLEGA